MDQKETLLTVARYVVDNPKTLKGMLSAPHFFHVGGMSISETRYEDSSLARGYAVDILADLIQKNKFFGWYIPENPDQATNGGNAGIFPLKKGSNLSFKLSDFEETENGLLVKIPLVKPRKYLDILKNPEDFKKYSEVVDLEKKNPKKIIDRLF